MHGTALKSYDRVPCEKKITNEKLFSGQEAGVNACFVICEELRHGIAEIIP